MGDMNLGQYQESVLLALKNVRTTHPMIVAGAHTRAINHAPNDLIRMAPERFPEHNDNTWTIGPTTVGKNLIALPTNLLILQKVRTNKAATDPGDWSSVREHIVSPILSDIIGLQEKTSAQTGYPSLYSRKGNNLHYYPTTQTGFACYFRAYGVAQEAGLVGAGDTFRLHRDYDALVVMLATAEVATLLGRAERAQELREEVKERMGVGVNVSGRERSAQGLRVSVAGMPR